MPIFAGMRKLTPDEITGRRARPDASPAGPQRTPVYGLLDNIRSLYNVGSMFRTSDGASVSGLFLCGYTPVPPRKEIDKTALGATSTVPWEFLATPEQAIARAKALGLRLCILEQTTESVPYYRIRKSDFPICLVVGNELTGVSPEFLASADLSIDIPMYGTKHSLNAAVAYGIALFDLLRVWNTG